MIAKYLNMFFLKIFLLILVFAAANNLIAQTENFEIAHPAPAGIFVDLGIDLVNQNHPKKNMIGYRIDRRLEKETEWKQLVVIGLPDSKQEFNNRINEYIQKLFPSAYSNTIPTDSLWSRVEKFHRLDSLGFWSGSLLIRLAVGSLYFDSDAASGVNYVYRVSSVTSANEIIESIKSNTVSFPVNYNQDELIFNSKSITEKAVDITWSSSNDYKPTTISVYKSEGANANFEKLDANLFVTSRNDSAYYSFIDTLITANTYYTYYAIPEDLYGNTGTKTEDVIIIAVDFSKGGYPYIVNAISLDSIDAIEVSWQIREKELVNYVEVYRSASFDSGFTKIADVPSQDSEYLDYNIDPMKKYEYYVRAVNMMGEYSISSVRVFAMTLSELTPIPPQNLIVESVKNGVKLSWENSEDFIDGFWVYRTDGIDDSLRLISTLIKETKPITEYFDTNGTLSGKLTYSYSIKSITTSHVESDFSDTLLIRPELPTMPPTPFDLIVFIEDSTAKISWYDMTEIDESVFGYRVYRKILSAQGDSNYEGVVDSMLPFNQNYIYDNDIEKGKSYQYAITSVDFFGGESSPAYSSDVIYNIPSPLPPLGVRYLNSENGIIIQWDETLQSEIKEYRVYRYQRNESPKLISSVKIHTELKAEDKTVKKDELYYYYVTSVNSFDIEGSKSNIVAVRL